jgi:hypothetical protein
MSFKPADLQALKAFVEVRPVSFRIFLYIPEWSSIIGLLGLKLELVFLYNAFADLSPSPLPLASLLHLNSN